MKPNLFKRLQTFFQLSFEGAHLSGKSVFYVPILAVKMLHFRLRFKGGLQLYVFYRYWSYGRINPAFHFTHQDNVDFVETINDQSQIYLLREKPILLERMGERLGREFINLAHCSTDEFFAFTSKHDKIIAKPPNKARGEDIRVISGPFDRTNSDELFTALVAEQCTLVEEYINQLAEIDRFHKNSVSIIKINTLNTGKEIRIDLPPLFQFGTGSSEISHRGYTLPLDPQTGAILWPDPLPRQLKNVIPNDYLSGRPLPQFAAALDFAKELAQIVPEITYVSWDIALTEKGPVVVEGNGAPLSFISTQAYFYKTLGIGAKQFYRNILYYAKERPRLSDANIIEIEDALFRETKNHDIIPDFMLVLGSSRCTYRIHKALELGVSNPNLCYIVSGGGKALECFAGEGNVLRSEAQYMREYLLREGVKEEQIIMDRRAKSTAQNIKNCLKILLSKIPESRPEDKLTVGVVTGGFHMQRTLDLINAHPESKHFNWQFYPAYGPNTQKGVWQDNVTGFSVVMSEYKKLEIHDIR